MTKRPKQPKTTQAAVPAEAPAFLAEVTMAGDIETGTATIQITQVDLDPPEPNPGPEPEPPPEAWEPPDWLRTDMDEVDIPSIARPGYLETYEDEVFHSKVTRITDNPGMPIENIPGMTWPDIARHHYSSDQAWNADGSRIYLDVPGILVDGQPPFKPVCAAKNRPSDSDVRWHHADPNLMLYVAGSILGTWNPTTGSLMEIEDFGDAYYSDMKFGPWEGSFSENGDMVVISCQYGGEFCAFAYSLENQEKWRDIPASEIAAGKCDNVRISSGGNYMIWNFDPDHVVVTDREGNKVTELPDKYISHFDVITDQNGDECVCGRVNSDSVGQGEDGLVSKYRLSDGERTGLTKGGWSSHTSCRAQTRRRWCVSDPGANGGNYPPYDGEIVMAELNGGDVYRICHSHVARAVDYKAETQASHSRDGGMVIFASTWGEDPRPVGCYVADFRE